MVTTRCRNLCPAVINLGSCWRCVVNLYEPLVLLWLLDSLNCNHKSSASKNLLIRAPTCVTKPLQLSFSQPLQPNNLPLCSSQWLNTNKLIRWLQVGCNLSQSFCLDWLCNNLLEYACPIPLPEIDRFACFLGFPALPWWWLTLNWMIPCLDWLNTPDAGKQQQDGKPFLDH